MVPFEAKLIKEHIENNCPHRNILQGLYEAVENITQWVRQDITN